MGRLEGVWIGLWRRGWAGLVGSGLGCGDGPVRGSVDRVVAGRMGRLIWELGFDIGKKGEIVGNFRLISGLLLLEIGVVG
jgi:hypothetical protein